MSVLCSPYFHDEAAAFAHLEAILWKGTPVCPHCGSVSGKHYDLCKTRVGLRKCSDCRKQFTVKVGTVFESAHIPLNKMLQGVYLMCASNKGISAHQIHHAIGVTYKSAWFFCRRIRECYLRWYLAEFGFCYNNLSKLRIEDGQQCANALAGIAGMRLTNFSFDMAI